VDNKAVHLPVTVSLQTKCLHFPTAVDPQQLPARYEGPLKIAVTCDISRYHSGAAEDKRLRGGDATSLGM
jgi:hypothetical protein